MESIPKVTQAAERTTAIVNVALKSEGYIVARAAEMHDLLKNYTAGHCRNTGFVFSIGTLNTEDKTECGSHRPGVHK
jgi:hypothetical protein